MQAARCRSVSLLARGWSSQCHERCSQRWVGSERPFAAALSSSPESELTAAGMYSRELASEPMAVEMYSQELASEPTVAATYSADAQEPVLPACSKYRRCLPAEQPDFAHRASSATHLGRRRWLARPQDRSTQLRYTLPAADFAYA